jgi:hypothetical protein
MAKRPSFSRAMAWAQRGAVAVPGVIWTVRYRTPGQWQEFNAKTELKP